MGSPAEEGGGGKVPLIDGGSFAGVDAAMMVHPADADLLDMDVVALHQAHVTYTGRGGARRRRSRTRAATPSTPPCSAT